MTGCLLSFQLQNGMVGPSTHCQIASVLATSTVSSHRIESLSAALIKSKPAWMSLLKRFRRLSAMQPGKDKALRLVSRPNQAFKPTFMKSHERGLT